MFMSFYCLGGRGKLRGRFIVRRGKIFKQRMDSGKRGVAHKIIYEKHYKVSVVEGGIILWAHLHPKKMNYLHLIFLGGVNGENKGKR